MTSKLLQFLFLSFTLIACAKHRPIPLDVQCDNDIKLASRHLNASKEDLEKDMLEKLTNLISAAKIQQQHGTYPACIDKAQRALTLLKADDRSKKSK